MCTEIEIEEYLKTLRRFNEKIDRLERSGFSRRFQEEPPNVLARMIDARFENAGNGQINIIGRMEAWIPDYNEDEVDAVVLTYRMLTQNNDRLSIGRLAELYNSEWFPEEGKNLFNNMRNRINDFLDSAATVEFPDGQIRIRTIMDVIIYGGLAHSNQEKEEIYNSWINSDVSGFFQVEFIAGLRCMLSYFSDIKNLNDCTIRMFEAAIESNN